MTDWSVWHIILFVGFWIVVGVVVRRYQASQAPRREAEERDAMRKRIELEESVRAEIRARGAAPAMTEQASSVDAAPPRKGFTGAFRHGWQEGWHRPGDDETPPPSP